ncbi:MAG: maleylpyruvate isomerase N-terminal domain-containing protein [Sporichthyaceae bacterium]
MDLDGTYTAICSAIEEVGARTAALVRAAPDPGRAVVGSAWTVREAAVHVVTDTTIHADLTLGKPMIRTDLLSRAGIAADNDRFIAAIPEQRLPAIADLIADAVTSFGVAAAGRAATDEVYWTPDLPVPVVNLAGLELGELILHGYDLAATLGVPWPIDPGHAQLVLFGYAPFFDTLVSTTQLAGRDLTYEIALRGGPVLRFRLVDGHCRFEAPGSGPVDCAIDADPIALLLVVSGRLEQSAAIALGLLAASGPRPELAGELTTLFQFP